MDLQSAPSYPKFAYTKDMWMEKYNSSHFLSVSVHHIDSNWELKKALLGINQFDEKKTTVNIRKDCDRILEKYFEPREVDNVISNSVSVTDGGSNMLSIFPSRKPCYCHKLNLFVEWTLNNKDLTSSEQQKYLKDNTSIRKKKLFKLSASCPKLQKSLPSLRDLVTHFKRTSLNSELLTTSKQDVVTRWNSELISITSYLNVLDEVKELCLRNDSLKYISGISDTSLKELQVFLQPIAEASEVLSGDTYPTIHQVALFFHQLEEHIEINSSDSAEMKTLKGQAALCFKEYCTLDDFCYMAAMFDPRYKSLQFAPPEARDRAIDTLKRLVAREEVECENKDADGASALTPQPHQSTKVSRFSKFKDSKEQSGIVFASEVERYRMYQLPDVDDDDFNILHFWRDAKDFPALQKVACWLIPIPASKTTEERVFSDADYVKTPRRTVLSGKHLSNLVFLGRNFGK